MTSKNKLYYALLFMSSFGFGQSSSDQLKELINSALERDGQYQQQNLELQYVDIDQKRLTDTFLPKVELTGRVGYMDTRINYTSPEFGIPRVPPLFPGMTVPSQNNTLGISGFSGASKLQASVVLYSGGKVGHLKKALNEKKLSQQELLSSSKNEVITSIAKIYDQFALVHQSKKVLDESKKRLEINRKTAEKALGYGLITPYDFKKIELAQVTLDTKMVEYEGKRELLITQLHILTGMDKERIAEIEPDLQVLNYVVEDKSIENRPEIKALNHGIAAAEYKIKAEKTWWIPKVQLSTSLSYFGLYGDHIQTSNDVVPYLVKKLDIHTKPLSLFPMFNAGIGFKWSLFDGNTGKREAEKSKIDKMVLENKKADAQRKLQLNLANNQTNYDIALAQIELKDKARKIAKNALDQVEKEFRYGVKKSMDLIDAENDLEKAELEYKTAVFNQRRAAIELMKSTQNLDVEKL